MTPTERNALAVQIAEALITDDAIVMHNTSHGALWAFKVMTENWEKLNGLMKRWREQKVRETLPHLRPLEGRRGGSAAGGEARDADEAMRGISGGTLD